jgi:type VI protein secretion system component VasF
VDKNPYKSPQASTQHPRRIRVFYWVLAACVVAAILVTTVAVVHHLWVSQWRDDLREWWYDLIRAAPVKRNMPE